MRAWQFRRTLDDIETAYHAAARVHASRPDEIELEVRTHLRLGADDPFPDRNDDDEFDPIGRQYDEAGEKDEQAGRGAHIVRKAFLIALFHHWERYCNARLQRAKYGHPSMLLNEMGRSGYAKAVKQLEHAANCAKHGPGHSCESLYKKRPDLFPGVGSAQRASESSMVVTEKTLEEFFATIKKVTE